MEQLIQELGELKQDWNRVEALRKEVEEEMGKRMEILAVLIQGAPSDVDKHGCWPYTLKQ